MPFKIVTCLVVVLVCLSIVVDADLYDCSEAGFASGLAAGGLVQFNCTSSSTTITLSPNVIYNWTSISTSIDGQDKIVIDGSRSSSWYFPTGSAHSVRNIIVALRGIEQDGNLTIEHSRLSITNQIAINSGVFSLEYSLLLFGAQESNCIEARGAGASFRCLGSTLTSASLQQLPNTLFSLNGSSLSMEFCTAANFATFASAASGTLSATNSIIFGQLTGLTPSVSTNNVYQYTAYGNDDTFQGIQTRVIGGFSVPAGGKYESYALVPCSPAINAGTSYVGMPEFDQHGRQRIQGGAPDIGAFESTSLPCLSIVGGPFTTVERSDFSLTVQVSVSSRSTIPVSVQYSTADDTATAGSDYTATSGTLTFNTTTTLITVPITILGDNVPELTESFLFVLSSPVNAGIVTDSVSIVITDDDRNVVSIPTSTVVVNDNGNNSVISVNVAVARVYESSVPVNVTVSVAEGNGTKSYFDVTFGPKTETVKNFTYKIESTFANHSRVFDVLIESAVNADISSASNTATITLTAYTHCGGGNIEVCSVHATCANTTTGLNCTCVEGYYGDGYVCASPATQEPTQQPTKTPTVVPPSRPPTTRPTIKPTIIPTTPPTGPPTLAATVEPPLDLIISLTLWDTLKDIDIEWLLIQYRARSVVTYIVEVYPVGSEPVAVYNGSATNTTLRSLLEGTTYVVIIRGISLESGLPLAIKSTNFTTGGILNQQAAEVKGKGGLTPGATIGLAVALLCAFLIVAGIVITWIVKHQSAEDKAKQNSLFDPHMIDQHKNRMSISLAGQGFGIREDSPPRKSSHKKNSKRNNKYDDDDEDSSNNNNNNRRSSRRDQYNRENRKSREDVYKAKRFGHRDDGW